MCTINARRNSKFVFRDTFQVIDDESLLSENDYERCNDKTLMGSISHRFGVTVKHLNSQYDYYNLEMAEDEIVLLQVCKQ